MIYQWTQQTSKWWTIDITPKHESRHVQTYDSQSTHHPHIQDHQQVPTPHTSELHQRYHCHPLFGASGYQTSILQALFPSPKSSKSMRHGPTIHRPYMQHDTDDRNYEMNLLVFQASW
jgi:hypothetical protein